MDKIFKNFRRIVYVGSIFFSFKSIVPYLITIFLPCFLIGDSSVLGYENSEHLYGSCMTENSISKEFVHIGDFMGRSMLLGKIDRSKGRSKGGAEFSSSFIVFGDFDIFFDSFNCKALLDNKTNEITGNSSKDSGGETVSYKLKIFVHDNPFHRRLELWG